MSQFSDLPRYIILYDGVCGLCHRAVKFVVRLDSKGVFAYAPLQGPTTARLRKKFPNIPTNLETIVYVDLVRERAFLRSQGFLQAAGQLSWPWKLGWYFRWFPAPVADLSYRLIAATRYRVFGKVDDACQLPTPAQRQRFLP